MPDTTTTDYDRESLIMHASGRPGKIEITPTKPLTTQRDLSLAYSPGVAAPCRAIAADPTTAYDYTAKGNLVAVISNGTAVLGLGNLGALASKPVMEGKAVLFKRFADVDAIDLEVATEDVDEFVNCVRFLSPSFGGVNLEDIKAPECFIIEETLRERMDIPVFHDDQHGTAIIAAAGLINAAHLTGRRIEDIRVVVNGAGAAAIACVALIKTLGVPHDNVILCDSKGVIFQGRTEGMNQWKSAHAARTDARTLTEAMRGADVFLGLSVKGAVTGDMVAAMGDRPIIFAMANPDPEITPAEAHAARPDAIVATGRSDYPNQVNNVLGFPYIFRGALDVRASTINDAMKIAAAHALADLARQDVPDEVAQAYSGRRLRFGPDYIIPVPFDPRLIWTVSSAVARAAMETGVARRPIVDMDAYIAALKARLDPTAGSLTAIFEQVQNRPKRVVFAEGEDEQSIRAALAFRASGYGDPILVARDGTVRDKAAELGLEGVESLEMRNARLSDRRDVYTEFLYRRLQRHGYLKRDCLRMINQDRNVFAACMVAMGDADAMVTGLTRNYHQAFEEVRRVIDPVAGQRAFGMTVLLARGRTVFIADTTVHERPEPDQLADFAEQVAAQARAMGHEPRVAFVSYSNFGHPETVVTSKIQDAVKILESRTPDFEFDGDMAMDVALDHDLMRSLYPFCRLSGPANVIIMPGLHTAGISTKLMGKMGGATVIGPLLVGMSKPVQIVHPGATVSDLVNMAVLAAHDAIVLEGA